MWMQFISLLGLSADLSSRMLAERFTDMSLRPKVAEDLEKISENLLPHLKHILYTSQRIGIVFSGCYFRQCVKMYINFDILKIIFGLNQVFLPDIDHITCENLENNWLLVKKKKKKISTFKNY